MTLPQRFIARVEEQRRRERPPEWSSSPASLPWDDAETFRGGIGSLPAAHTAFEPRPDDDGGVRGRFQPRPDDVDQYRRAGPLFPVWGEVPGGVAINEDDVDGPSLMRMLNDMVPGLNFTATVGKNLNSLIKAPMKLDIGRFPWCSLPDAFITRDASHPLAVLERKHGSLMKANAQLIAYGEQMANNLLHLGLAVDQIVVPTVAYTGRSIQFGATFMMPPSFSVHTPVSPVIDLTRVENHAFAAAILKRLKEQVDRLHVLLNLAYARAPFPSPMKFQASPPEEFVKSEDIFYVKWMSAEVCEKGFDLLSLPSPKRNASATLVRDLTVANGIAHMFRVLNALYAESTTRDLVVYPIATVSRGANILKDEVEIKMRLPPALVFPNIYLQHYKMGVPYAQDEFEAYLLALETAITGIGNAGVVHFDLYPSNKFYKTERTSSSPPVVKIKIVDWDLAHLVAEGKIPDNMRRNANDRWMRTAVRNNEGLITPEYDRHFLSLYQKLRGATDSIRMRLASDDANEIKDAFREHVRNVEGEFVEDPSAFANVSMKRKRDAAELGDEDDDA